MKNSIVLILPDIRSAMNVGAILRTADAAGVDKVYLTGYTATPRHPKVSKTSLGAEESVSWDYFEDTLSLLTKLRKDSYQIVSLEKNDDSKPIWITEFSSKVALVIGNEIHGVDDEILKLSDVTVHLPMNGIKESLNVATATGIATYEILRVHSKK